MDASTLHLLLPFAWPVAPDASAALRGLKIPAFNRLLAHATVAEQMTGGHFEQTLPHERWLARAFGVLAPLAPAASAGDEMPLAPYMLLADGGTPGNASWACVQPVHLRLAHDHLVLIDPAALALSADEAQALFITAQPLCDELGLTLIAPTPLRWYIAGAPLGDLRAASPWMAAGRSAEIWLPHEAGSGERSRIGMKLINTVQMAWFEHPVNRARESRGALTANSLWLYAQGRFKPAACSFSCVASNAAATRGLALAAGIPPLAAPAELSAFDTIAKLHPADGPMLVELDTLSIPFIRGDWELWRTGFAALERDWFAPALAKLQAGRLKTLAFTLSDDSRLTTLTVTRRDLCKFWRKQSVASLAKARR